MFKRIAAGLGVPSIHYVPGEHDGGKLYREQFGETSYSFDYGGVHFVAAQRVARQARGRPRADRLAEERSRAIS